MNDQFLVCDLSLRSSVKFALIESGQSLGQPTTYDCDNSGEFEDRLKTFLSANDDPILKGAALATRGWEENEVMQSVEADLYISRHDMRALLGIQRVNIVNNFVARALAVPHLLRHERARIFGEEQSTEQVIAVLGPHYGLGSACLVSEGGGSWRALPGEGGHSDLPAKTDREWEIVRVLVATHGYASRETALSLQGVVNIWEALHVIDGKSPPALTPLEIIDKARWSQDARALETIRLIAVWLGAFASDLALIVGARGGVYLTGALVDMIGDNFDTKAFLDRFLDKGPRKGYLNEIPVFRTLVNDLELRGLATLFD